MVVGVQNPEIGATHTAVAREETPASSMGSISNKESNKRGREIADVREGLIVLAERCW